MVEANADRGDGERNRGMRGSTRMTDCKILHC